MFVRVLRSRPRLHAAILLAFACACLSVVISPAAGRATGRAAAATCSTPGSGFVADFCFQPTGTAAGSNPGFDTTIAFDTAGTTNTAENLTVTLAPGLLAIPTAPGATCSQAELAAGTCPAASEVGTGTVTAGYPGLSELGITSYSALYAMAVPAADAAREVAAFGLGIWLGSSAPPAGRAPVQTAAATASVTSVGGRPAVELAFDGLPTSLPLTTGGLALPIQVQRLTLDIAGTVTGAGGKPVAFTRLPTSCTTAATTMSVDAVSLSGGVTAAAGRGTDSFTPTGCAALPFTPSLSVRATKDAGDLGTSFAGTISQPSGQSAASSIELSVPVATLAPNLAAALGQFGATVGSAEAVTPLLSSPLIGTLALTGTVANPFLTITFPPPVPLTLTGAIDIVGNTVTFTGLPDVPLSSLTVTLNGGAGALYATVCSSPYGVAEGAFVAQSGATASDGAPFTISDCTVPEPPAPGAAAPGPTVTTPVTTPSGTSVPVTLPPTRPPTLSGARLSGLSGGAATVRFSLAAGTAQLESFAVSLPRGLSFVGRRLARGVTLSGGRIGSLELRRGCLIVALRSPASRVAVTLSASALDEQAALRAAARRTRRSSTLTGAVTVTSRGGALTHLRLRLRT